MAQLLRSSLKPLSLLLSLGVCTGVTEHPANTVTEAEPRPGCTPAARSSEGSQRQAGAITPTPPTATLPQDQQDHSHHELTAWVLP